MMVSSVPECRICYGLSSPESPLLEPCLCSGTLQFVHESCIVRFHVLNPEKPLACDVCKYCYDVKQTKELQAHRIRNIYRNLAKIGASTFAMHYTLSLNCCFHFVHSDLALIFSNFVWPLLAFDLLRFWYNYEAVDQLFWLAGQDAKEMVKPFFFQLENCQEKNEDNVRVKGWLKRIGKMTEILAKPKNCTNFAMLSVFFPITVYFCATRLEWYE